VLADPVRGAVRAIEGVALELPEALPPPPSVALAAALTVTLAVPHLLPLDVALSSGDADMLSETLLQPLAVGELELHRETKALLLDLLLALG